jgi:hypothetical protein
MILQECVVKALDTQGKLWPISFSQLIPGQIFVCSGQHSIHKGEERLVFYAATNYPNISRVDSDAKEVYLEISCTQINPYKEIERFNKYFVSANEIPVDRAVIPTAEWEKVSTEIKAIARLAGVTLEI